MPTTSVRKVSGNGQVSIPVAARRRWRTDRVVAIDLGDRVVIRPASADAISELAGRYRGRGPTSEAMRSLDRAEAEAEAERVDG